MTWLVATWIATVDVKADITGAETKLRRKPEKKGTGLRSVTHLVIDIDFENLVLGVVT